MSRHIKKQIYQYTAVFEAASEGGFTVTIPELPGCISEGDTFEQALNNIQEAATLYADFMQERQNVYVHHAPSVVLVPVQIAI